MSNIRTRRTAAILTALVLPAALASCIADDPRFGPLPPKPPADAPMVDGIGGAFIYSRDPARLAKWYEKNLGITLIENKEDGGFYHEFLYRNLHDPNRRARTVWAILPVTDESGGTGRRFMVNYRVNGLDRVLEHLRANDVKVLSVEEYDYGRFAWIEDADGNRIELFEEKLPL